MINNGIEKNRLTKKASLNRIEDDVDFFLKSRYIEHDKQLKLRKLD